jgi:hypothetical protein
MNSFTVNDVEIPFDYNWSSIAISLSGGADSALLAYLLCDHIQKNNIESFTIHIISHTRMWKTKPWQEHDSLAVFRWLLNEFPNITFHRHTNFIAPELEWGDKGPTIIDEYGKLVSGDNVELRAFGEYVCYHNKVNAYYNAVTRNPKNVKFKGMPTRDIDPTDDNQHLRVMEHMGLLACHPFRFVDKSWVVDTYNKINKQDLFYMTRSCEGDNTTRPEVFLDLDYRTYKPGQSVPICGRCFWCKERAWAIEQSK